MAIGHADGKYLPGKYYVRIFFEAADERVCPWYAPLQEEDHTAASAPFLHPSKDAAIRAFAEFLRKQGVSIGDTIAAKTEPIPEVLARGITFGADEHFLIAVAGLFWLYSRFEKPSLQNAASHLPAVTLASSVLFQGCPHSITTPAGV